MRVDYLIPGLLELPLQELDSDFLRQNLPHMNRMLGLASPRPNRAFSIDAMLLAALGQQTAGDAEKPGQGLPMAQAFAPGQSGARHMLFQAIHLKPDMHSALILPLEKTSESTENISVLIKDLSDFFKVDCHISAVDDETYIMSLHGFDVPLHYPHPLSVLGKSANPYIEQSRAIMPWYQLLNEMQMYLHQHPLNQQRVKSGQLPINSLWCWGGGELLKPDRRPRCYCDDFLLQGFSRSIGLQVDALTQLDLASGAQDVLVIDLRLLRALKTMQQQPLNKLLLDMDASLFKPVLARVNQGLSGFRLSTGSALDFELNRYSRYRFWRKPKNIGDWMTHRHDF